MNKFLQLFFLLVIFNNIAFGQERYLKLIEKGKYSKAEKKINKALIKKPDDVVLNYSMATLLINRKNKGYNPEKSYSFLLKTESALEAITDEREIKKLNKIPINRNVIFDYTDTIGRFALEDAQLKNNLDVYEKYLEYYTKVPYNYTKKAIENRDIAAYKIACKKNTLESYTHFTTKYPHAVQYEIAIEKRDAKAFEEVKAIDNISAYKKFISNYPNAKEIKQAWERVHELAYEEVKATDNINAFKKFISNYPSAKEIKQAWKRIHELAYAFAEKENNSVAFKNFIDEYPQSKQYEQAFRLFEERQFIENTFNADWKKYRLFIENYPSNSWKTSAEDSILQIGVRTEDLEPLKYCIDNFTGLKKTKALFLFHDAYTNDGEKITLDLFYSNYDDDLFTDLKLKDYELSDLGDKLNLNGAYIAQNFNNYDEYIRLAAPKEKAFVALQRIISHDIAIKDWKSALNKTIAYLSYFGNRKKKIVNLISILEAKSDNTIKINFAGTGINTEKGGEYCPTLSADDKLLYFCGRNRKDNIGGEDIFVSKKTSNNIWGPAKLVQDLSSVSQNDAPLSIAADGTKILLFKSGKLLYSEKTSYGWDEAVEFPSQINSTNWQADAMISSDGKALIFVQGIAVGQDPSAENLDIFVSLLNENDEWDEPINIGNTINTPYCDRTPFLHPDMKTLYFSSDGLGGLGKLDVFKSTRLSDTCWNCWSEPVNMGKEINTEEQDWGYKISTDGERAFFSKRASAIDMDEIFWLNIPKHLRPDLVATVSGKLTDKNNQPVSADIRWEDLETGKKVGQSKSDPADGSFFIVLPLGKIYGYYVDKDEYFPISKNIDLRTNSKSIQIEEDIDMVTFKQMVEDGTAVPVNNLFFNFSESSLLPYSLPELKRVAQIIKANTLKTEIGGHTDNVGDDKQNQNWSEKRANAVKDFLIKEGCLESNLITIGYGKTKPIASNETEAGRAKNRRVELKFVK